MTQHPSGLSRRRFLSTSGTLLAAFGLSSVVPGTRAIATPTGTATSDLALARPVTVSSTDYAPTPAQFAVDGIAEVGVRGSGWRAAQGDPQWIVVDLQAQCRITSVVLTFEAKPGDPAVRPDRSPAATPRGFEIQSSYALAFDARRVRDGKDWTTVYQHRLRHRRVTTIPLATPVTAPLGAAVRLEPVDDQSAGPQRFPGLRHRERPTGRRRRALDRRGRSHHDRPAGAHGGRRRHRAGRVRLGADHGRLGRTGDGAALSGPTVDTSAWLPATVPGTVLGVAGRTGPPARPGVRHEQPAHPGGAVPARLVVPPRRSPCRAVWTRRRGRHVWLEFDGVNNEADIWLNGTSDRHAVPPVRPGRVRRHRRAHADGEQALAVQDQRRSRIPAAPATRARPERPTWTPATSMFGRTRRRYVSVSGWDWMPAVRDRAAGIWNHVRLRSTGAVVLGDARVDTALPDLPATTAADVTITVPVRNATRTAQRVTV